MLGVFEKSKGKPPMDLNLPSVPRPEAIRTRADIAQFFLKMRKESDTTFYNFPNGNFMALSEEDEIPPQPRSIVVMDDIFCIFFGTLDNITDVRQFYGLPKRSTEAMILHAAYKVLRDRSPYPPDQVLKQFQGKFAFMLFDAKYSVLFLARDREGRVELHWGTASDGSLVCSDDQSIIIGVCGNIYTPFPPGCLFLGANLISYDHPLHMVKATEHKDDYGNTRALIFRVDLHTRFRTIPRTGSGDNWAAVSTTATLQAADNEKEK
ncbi:hypothetical protein ACH5RR_015092 [Cinchona calisaya]|uniref:DUF3700 domain-containing protein n=1 Tax=Cinchona calisaya TaxID=153742 RepID=A0ABD2ZXF1_9GENT